LAQAAYAALWAASLATACARVSTVPLTWKVASGSSAGSSSSSVSSAAMTAVALLCRFNSGLGMTGSFAVQAGHRVSAWQGRGA